VEDSAPVCCSSLVVADERSGVPLLCALGRAEEWVGDDVGWPADEEPPERAVDAAADEESEAAAAAPPPELLNTPASARPP
jgi:hypothetical protein